MATIPQEIYWIICIIIAKDLSRQKYMNISQQINFSEKLEEDDDVLF